jgi:hypothetical protein
LRAADIAERAGISASSLSRVRSTGRYNSDTLERLLGAVQGEVSVTASRTIRSPLSLIVKKLNAGRKIRFETETFRRIIRCFRPSKEAERAFSHLVGLLEELRVEQLHDLVIAGDTSFRSLKRIADYVDAQGPNIDWIHETINAGGTRERVAGAP